MEGYSCGIAQGSKAKSYMPSHTYLPQTHGNFNSLNALQNTYASQINMLTDNNESNTSKYAPSKEGIYNERFENQIYNYFLEKYSNQLKELPEQYKKMLEEGEVYKAAYHILKDKYAENKGESKLKTEKDIEFFYDLMKLYVLGSYKEGLSDKDKEFLFYEAAPLYLDKQGLLPAETLAVAVNDTQNGYSIMIKSWLTHLPNHKYLMEVLAHEYIHILQYYLSDKYANGQLPDEKDMEAQATLHSLELMRQIDSTYKSVADPTYIAWAKEYAEKVGINPAWLENPESDKYASDIEKYKRYLFNPEYYNEEKSLEEVMPDKPQGKIIKEPYYKYYPDDVAVNRGVLH